jgi:hypothetical protein
MTRNLPPPGRGGLLSPATAEVRYERSFITDLKQITPLKIRDRIQNFVFTDFYAVKHLQYLEDFRPMATSQIFYRFTVEDYLVSIEVTGEIIKFVRVLPKPRL